MAQLIDPSSRTWNLKRILNLISPRDAESILRIPIPLTNMSDKLIWSPNKKGLFSVKFAYFLSSSPISHDSPLLSPPPIFPWKLIWALNIPPKVKHFLWRASKEALPVKENLIIKKTSVSDLYPLCKEAKETTMHCSVKCDQVASVWYVSPLCLRTSNINLNYFKEWVKFLLDYPMVSKYNYLNILCTIAIFAWNIWKSRNKVVFDKCDFNMFNTFSATFRMMNESNIRFGSFWYPDVQNDHLA